MSNSYTAYNHEKKTAYILGNGSAWTQLNRASKVPLRKRIEKAHSTLPRDMGVDWDGEYDRWAEELLAFGTFQVLGDGEDAAYFHYMVTGSIYLGDPDIGRPVHVTPHVEVLEDRILALRTALTTIAEIPTQKQDNMLSANMRKIAADALKQDE